MTYASTVLADTPHGYWRLQDTSGTTAVDSSGNGYNGTYSGAAVGQGTGTLLPSEPGYSNWPGPRDTGTSEITCPAGASMGVSAFSVEAWYLSSAAGGTAGSTLIEQKSTSSITNEYALLVDQNGHAFFFTYNGSAYGVNLTGATNLNDGHLHHIVAVVSGASGSLYVDGMLTASATGTSVTLSTSLTTYIGVDGRAIGLSTSPTAVMAGVLGEIAIYTYALTATQVEHHYEVGSGLAATTHDFGIYLSSPTFAQTYRDGARVACYSVTSQSGSYLALAAYQATSHGTLGVRIDKLEAWTAPGGTLVQSWDFADLTGWTQNGSNWTAGNSNAIGAGAVTSDTNQCMWLTQPAGAAYFLARAVWFADQSSNDEWVMIIPNRVTPGQYADSGTNVGGGYRCLLRPPGYAAPWNVELPDGTVTPCPDVFLGVNVIRMN